MLTKIIEIDKQLLAWFNNLPLPENCVVLLAEVETYIVMVLLVVMWLFGVKKKDTIYKQHALLICYSAILALIAGIILSQILPMRMRPDLLVTPIIEHIPDNSFPSTHGMFAGATFFMTWLLGYQRIGKWLCFFGVVMVLARVVAGIHYPTDVIAGFALGMGIAQFLYTQRFTKVVDGLIRLPIYIASYIRL